MKRLFLSPPHQSGRELDAIREALESNFLAPAGPQLAAFEAELSRIVGPGEHGRPLEVVGLASGTAALHLALVIAGVGPGDMVLCSDLTFVASAAPIRYVGAEPLFVDANDSWNLDPALIETFLETLTARGFPPPKALIAVNLFGSPCDLPRLTAICERFGVTLIEDAAESLGSSVNGRPSGSFGRFAALSFNGNKIVVASGGGALVCRDPADAEKARFLAGMAKDPGPGYRHSELGFSYGLSNLLAALGSAQLADLGARVAKRREISDLYRECLGGPETRRFLFMPEPPGVRANRWLTACLVAPEEPVQAAKALRDRILAALWTDGVEAKALWTPMHRQPLFAESPVLGGETADDLAARGLCLPSGTGLLPADVERVCRVIRTAFH